MPRPVATILGLVLLVWCLASTGLALRYHQQATRLAESGAEASLEIADLQKRVKKAETTRPATAPAPTIIMTSAAPAVVATDDAARVQELEAALREREQALAALRQGGMSNRPPGFPRGGPDGSSWLEDMKKNEPERYAEFMKRREEAREQTQRAFAEKAAHFLERDVSKLSPEQQDNHKALLTLLDETWKLSEQLRADLPTEQRQELMTTMRENMHNLGPLLATERENEFYLAARGVGLSDPQSAQFVEQMNKTIEATSMRSLFDGMRGGGRGGPGGGGPGGGGR